MGTHMLEKVYDEGRASMASQLAVDDEYDEDGFDTIVAEMKEKYWYAGVCRPDMQIEVRCWAATEQLIEMLHLSDETIGLPMPPLYQEVCMDPKIFEAKKGSVELKIAPRFAKMKKLELIDWLIDKWHFVAAKGYSTLEEEVNRVDMHLTRAQLVGLCERVWSVL